MMKKNLIVGTRGSKLALKQTEIVIDKLKHLYPGTDFTVKTIKTKGDTVWDRPLHLIGGKGLFVKEIEEALLSREVDIAVHSMKDVPTDLAEGLTIGAILEREDPRDAFISNTYDRLRDVEEGARIGTNSLRRKSQLLRMNSTIDVMSLRGNVDTRIRKMETEGLDGIILALAGVRRMGFEGQVKEILPLDIMIPPSGQGAIGIETRDEPTLLRLLQPVNHITSFQAVSIERTLQTRIGGGCSVPLGIHAAIMGEELTLYLSFGTEDGKELFRDKQSCPLRETDRLVSNFLERLSHHL
jgi:hydroxymethylbilane synthase